MTHAWCPLYRIECTYWQPRIPSVVTIKQYPPFRQYSVHFPVDKHLYDPVDWLLAQGYKELQIEEQIFMTIYSVTLRVA